MIGTRFVSSKHYEPLLGNIFKTTQIFLGKNKKKCNTIEYFLYMLNVFSLQKNV